ncbi:response regulator [Candidatus Nitronereus thalassa]|uniref:histidine kinase n=1 Tax=Candidatus Nitronereus thalassa TaxID=3020898 RepID=A0ABU3KB29_9BACT|nr:response regulator [Candidatus Nitronereus thalassa]MDT7043641.1 response regulator [Candidatus Nitronereus thalassa]
MDTFLHSNNSATLPPPPLSQAPITILIIEDDEEDFILVRDCLNEIGSNYFHIEWSKTFADGLKALMTHAYDVCLLDYYLGTHTGVELLQQLTRLEENTPAILMVSGEPNPEADIQAMKAGAMDFLVKSELHPSSAERSIRHALSHRLNQLALKDYAMELERKNQELAIARDDAMVADRLKTEFLSNISHETRTPLNGMMGLIQLLKDTPLTTEQRGAMQALEDCTETLLVLINNLLDFSKLVGGNLDLQNIDFDIRTTIDDIITRLTPQAQRKNLDLLTMVQATVPGMIKGDPGRLRQIMNNLLGNAIKFTESGEIQIRVTVEGQAQGTIFLRLCVADTGIGISEKQQNHLFEIFSQADGSSTRLHSGAGVGLSVTKHLAELLGGTIEFDSTVGKGSRFWVTIPFSTSLTSKDESQASTFDPGKLKASLFCANPVNQSSIIHHCRMLGMLQETSSDFEQGLKVLKEAASHGCKFDVMIIDHSLPTFDGFSFAERVKADDELQHLPILMITEGSRGEAQKAQEVGIAAYLTTPFQHWQFSECLRLMVHPSSQASSNMKTHSKSIITKHSLRDAQAKGKTRILLVDDNAVNQKVIIRTLEALGTRVDVVDSGQDAAMAVHLHPYHMVLCDQWLSEFDPAAMATLSQRLLESSIPMILMTNVPDATGNTFPTKYPVVATLPKPIRREDLAEMILQWAHNNDLEEAGTPIFAISSERKY